MSHGIGIEFKEFNPMICKRRRELNIIRIVATKYLCHISSYTPYIFNCFLGGSMQIYEFRLHTIVGFKIAKLHNLATGSDFERSLTRLTTAIFC